ncbi:MAG: hypothetical protein AMXMBFR82_25370 [Candidatus Hydrogenedentota bacterium]
MDVFPAADPIPLPAPVWLFKALHSVTLVLHFFSVHFLVGGLLLAIIWSFVGRSRKDAVLLNASGMVTHRLPIVMTYVINLGVPPLLFTQVLYGRGLYTSSVLIGAWWISVVALLIVSYTFLYIMSSRAESGRAAGWAGLIALIVVLKIGFIYTNNMTLMLRPDVWGAMYENSAAGVQFHSGDPTMMPRWLYMILGSIGVAGIALLFIGMKSTVDDGVAGLLTRWGGRLLAGFTVVQIALGFWVFRTQPEAVRAGLTSGAAYPAMMGLWAVSALAAIGLGVMVARRTRVHGGLVSIAALAAFLNVFAMVLLRDGIRDLTLAAAGFDVWAREVATNWSIVIIFLLCFMLALVMMVWLISVVARAKAQPESYAAFADGLVEKEVV